MKTSELIGAQLDWAVAKCEGINWYLHDTKGVMHERGEISGKYHPSTSPAQAYPIILRKKIATMWWTGKREWAAKPDSKKGDAPNHFGPDPLIAAMRCYVASELGDDVEMPEGLK